MYDYCQQQDPPQSISGFVEIIVKKALDEAGAATPREITHTTRSKKEAYEEDPPWGNHFTF